MELIGGSNDDAEKVISKESFTTILARKCAGGERQISASTVSTSSSWTESSGSSCDDDDDDDDTEGGDVPGGREEEEEGRQQQRRKRFSYRRVHFFPTARARLIEHKNTLSDEEKRATWWQPLEYAKLRETAIVIARNTYPPSNFWDGKEEEGSDDQTHVDGLFSSVDGWWGACGHSRRGLEHVSCEREGQERRELASQSVRFVVEEQKRLRSEGMLDRGDIEECLWSLSVHQTKWASDLAWASAASDADAVECEFAVDQCKTRDHFMIVMMQQQQEQQANSGDDDDDDDGAAVMVIPDFISSLMPSSFHASMNN